MSAQRSAASPDGALTIDRTTARRFLLGRQGLWPGRRWRDLRGTEAAMRTMEHVQLDPLAIMARAQDLALQGRVIDYRIDDWATLTYGKRRFFDWGGWLAVRPMDELPAWRVLMGREAADPAWQDVARRHAATIDEMRRLLRERGELANRDFAMRSRTRVDSYRGRKDSAIALYYLWRIGEVMVTRRERFERVYALTEAVAPAWALEPMDPAAADELLLRKSVAAQGLTRFIGLNSTLLRPVPPAELRAWREARVASGDLLPVAIEGDRRMHWALATDRPALETLAAGRTPRAWRPLEATTTDEVTFLSPLEPVRARAEDLFDFHYRWEVYVPAPKRRYGYYVLPVLWGDRFVARFDARLDRPARTLRMLGLWLEDPALADAAAFAEALGRGMRRFLRFLDADAVDPSGVPQPALRRSLGA